LVLLIGLTGVSGCVDQKSNNTSSNISNKSTYSLNGVSSANSSKNTSNSINNHSTNQNTSKDYIMYKGVKYGVVYGWNHEYACPYCGVLDRNLVAQVVHNGYLYCLIHCNNCGRNYAT